ncbi:MAG: hypothetical protein KAT48_07145 [Bacteroidales bacterium]|nr:hypothetical protein [Bacteroidales bacterium]
MLLALNYTYAQAPQAINYQAIIRDTFGTIIPNQNLQIKISILQDSVNGTAVYSETHTVNTNSFGLVNLAIGNGTVVLGDFSEIDWGESSYYLKIEIDITGGNNFAEIGTSQMLAVPYAFNASSLNLHSPDSTIWSTKISSSGKIYGVTKDFFCPDSIVDQRDGKVYELVQIGSQCWMAENLNVGIRIDSNLLPTDDGIIEKFCYHDIDNNCNIYGGLYWWDEVMDYDTIEGIQGICPDGWHIPTYGDWGILIEFLGWDAGMKMKEADTVHWEYPNIANNESGFTALPAGYYSNYQMKYGGLGYYTWFSSSSLEFYPPYAPGENDPFSRRLCHYSRAVEGWAISRLFAVSIRCIKN